MLLRLTNLIYYKMAKYINFVKDNNRTMHETLQEKRFVEDHVLVKSCQQTPLSVGEVLEKDPLRSSFLSKVTQEFWPKSLLKNQPPPPPEALCNGVTHTISSD